jgi:hypothetical protein
MLNFPAISRQRDVADSSSRLLTANHMQRQLVYLRDEVAINNIIELERQIGINIEKPVDVSNGPGHVACIFRKVSVKSGRLTCQGDTGTNQPEDNSSSLPD